MENEFKSNEDLYAYAAENSVQELDRETAYKHMKDNLLPIFKASKELCEYISGDDDYLNNQPLQYIGSMALVSRSIKAINAHCETLEDKKLCLYISNMETESRYFKNRKPQAAGKGFLQADENKGFFKLVKNQFFHMDDAKMYLSAFSDDITSSEKNAYSVEGNILDWQAMKQTILFKQVTNHFVIKEMEKLCKEQRISWKDCNKVSKQAHQTIQTKINEFCDLKYAQNIKQMQNMKSKVNS